MTRNADPILWRAVDIPSEYCITEVVNDAPVSFRGDVRIGDLRGTGRVDLLVYRSCDDAHDGGGMKPCFPSGPVHANIIPGSWTDLFSQRQSSYDVTIITGDYTAAGRS